MMCPDRQILSVYLDGELPSPWKEKMEAHLAECPQCREKLEAFALISHKLEAAHGSGDAAAAQAVTAAQERVWLKLAGAANAGPQITPFPARRYIPNLWRRTVSLPLPAAAALTAAAAAFVIVLASAWLRPATAPQPQNTAAVATGIELDLQGTIPVSDMNGVLQYLGDTDAGDIVILRLPENRNFRSSGEPTILKAADYRPAGRVPPR
jgi:anti-sigma factor RsiW